MQRRSFLKNGLTAGGLAALGIDAKPLLAHIPYQGRSPLMTIPAGTLSWLSRLRVRLSPTTEWDSSRMFATKLTGRRKNERRWPRRSRSW